VQAESHTKRDVVHCQQLRQNFVMLPCKAMRGSHLTGCPALRSKVAFAIADHVRRWRDLP
jgi:hypothetical protein